MTHKTQGILGSRGAAAAALLACLAAGCRRSTPAPTPTPAPSASAAASASAPSVAPSASASAAAPSVVPSASATAAAPAASAGPGAAPQNERVTAYLREHNLLDSPDQYSLLDLDGDGLQDVFSTAGVALQGPQSFRDIAAEVSSLGSTVLGTAARTPRGVLLPIGATGHEVINDVPGQAPYSMTWMDWSVFVLEQGALRVVLSDRFDENTAFDYSGPLYLTSQPDGTVLERSNVTRRLRWSGDHLEADSCWGGEPVPPSVEGCTVTLTAGSHPRATETAARERDSGELRPGTSVVVRYAGSVRRGVARMYCAHEPNVPDSSWVFLTPTELAGCPMFAQ